MRSDSKASTAVTPRYRPSSPGGRATPAGRFGEADPLGQRRLHDVETMLMDSNQKVDRLTSKLTASHQEVQRMRTQLEAHDKDLVYQTRLAERVKREQEQLPSPPPCTRAHTCAPGGCTLMLRSFACALRTPHALCAHSVPPARRSALAKPLSTLRADARAGRRRRAQGDGQAAGGKAEQHALARAPLC